MRILAMTLLMVVVVVPAHSQTLLVGASGGDIFNNASLGPSARAELPIGHHFEVDPAFTIYPECKSGYGCGWGQNTKLGGIVWAMPRFGIRSSAEYGSYSLPPLRKTAWYVSTGSIFRITPFGVPSRMGIAWIRQVGNGIVGGVETNHVEGGEFTLESHMGSAGPFSFRVEEELVAGRVLNQGNPVCDGSFPLTTLPPCPRSVSVSGGAQVTFYMEWPRRRGREDAIF